MASRSLTQTTVACSTWLASTRLLRQSSRTLFATRSWRTATRNGSRTPKEANNAGGGENFRPLILEVAEAAQPVGEEPSQFNSLKRRRPRFCGHCAISREHGKSFTIAY